MFDSTLVMWAGMPRQTVNKNLEIFFDITYILTDLFWTNLHEYYTQERYNKLFFCEECSNSGNLLPKYIVKHNNEL